MKFTRSLHPVLGKDCVLYKSGEGKFTIAADRLGVQLQGQLLLEGADDYEEFARTLGAAAQDHRKMIPRIISPGEANHER